MYKKKSKVYKKEKVNTPQKEIKIKKVSRPIKQKIPILSVYTNVIKSYNLYYLRNLEEYEKEFESTKLVISSKNYTLNQLVEKYEYNLENSIIFKYISGPKTFYELHNHENKMTVYIFGENHASNENCSSIMKEKDNKKVFDNENYKKYSLKSDMGQWLLENGTGDIIKYKEIENVIKKISNNSPVFLDVYLEDDLHYIAKNKKSAFPNGKTAKIMNNIKKDFIGRLHYVDIRGSATIIKSNQINILPPLLRLVNSMEIIAGSNIYDYKLRKKIAPIFLKYYKIYFNDKLDYYKWKEQLIIGIFDNKYLKKEIEKSYKGIDIKNFFYKKIETLLTFEEYEYQKDDYENIYQYTENLINENINKDLTENEESLTNEIFIFGGLSNFIIDIISYTVDIYTLCRIFKKFNVVNDLELKKPKNIIIYVGDFHAKAIKDYFLFLDYDLKNGKQIGENCVYTTMKTPFFYK